MDIYIMLFLLCVSVAGSTFLGHAAGYRRGIIAGRRQGQNRILREAVRRHHEEIGL